MPLTPLERQLKAELLTDATECLRLRPPYNPHIFVDMVNDPARGPVGACRDVIMQLPASQAPYGYAQLWERKRLDLTAEVTVLKPQYSALFDPLVLERAAARLKRCGWKLS